MNMSTLSQQCVHTRVLGQAEGLSIQLASSVKQEVEATATLPVWALLRCQSQQQMFVNKLSVSNKPATGLINHNNPSLPYKPCQLRRNFANIAKLQQPIVISQS